MANQHSVYFTGDIANPNGLDMYWAHNGCRVPCVVRAHITIEAGRRTSVTIDYDNGSTSIADVVVAPATAQPVPSMGNITCSIPVNDNCPSHPHRIVKGDKVIINDPDHGTLTGTVAGTWALSRWDKIEVSLDGGALWTGPSSCVVLAAKPSASPKKFTDADIGKRVRAQAPSGNVRTGTIVSIGVVGSMYPVTIDCDGKNIGHASFTHEEIEFETGYTTAAAVCDECGGTGEVELLMGFVPCSKGCKK